MRAGDGDTLSGRIGNVQVYIKSCSLTATYFAKQIFSNQLCCFALPFSNGLILLSSEN